MKNNTILAGAVLLCLVVSAQADITRVWGDGAESNRINLMILAEGYTAAEEADFIDDICSVSAYMYGDGGLNADPYPRYRSCFNVYGVFVPSAQSGLGGYFGSNYSIGPLWVDTVMVSYVIRHQFPTADLISVAVNTTSGAAAMYQGPAVWSTNNSTAKDAFLHEGAHAWHNLADTYVVHNTAYTGGEFPQVNLTIDPTGSKWSEWLGYEQPGVGTIGAYNGAQYSSGVFSPAPRDKMRWHVGTPFDAVCREKIIQDIYTYVTPLDSYTSNSGTLFDPASLSVVPFDDDVIDVSWKVDGNPFATASENVLDVAAMGLDTGPHTIIAEATDLTPWVRRGGENMSQSVTWDVQITVPEPAALSLLILGGLAAMARRRPPVQSFAHLPWALQPGGLIRTVLSTAPKPSDLTEFSNNRPKKTAAAASNTTAVLFFAHRPPPCGLGGAKAGRDCWPCREGKGEPACSHLPLARTGKFPKTSATVLEVEQVSGSVRTQT